MMIYKYLYVHVNEYFVTWQWC